jgi:hypothetical protein
MSEVRKVLLTAVKQLAGWLAFAIGMFVLLVLLSRSCGREAEAMARLERMEKASELKDQGFLVAIEAQQGVLDSRAAQIPELQEQIKRLKKSVKEARIIRVGHIETEPAEAQGDSLPQPAAGEPCPDCKFATGNRGKIVIDSVDLETKEGVQVAVVSAGCERISPGPKTRFLSGVGSAELSEMMTSDRPAERSAEKEKGLVISALAGVALTETGVTPVIGGSFVSKPFLLDRIAGTAHMSGGPGVVTVLGGLSLR